MTQALLDNIAPGPGTYLLVFMTEIKRQIKVGRLSHLDLRPGCYIYIGSAFGPGGIRSRVKHHARVSSRPHWHLDYIRPFLTLETVWYSHDETRHECHWATAVAQQRGVRYPLPGFGASDCQCESHLFYFSSPPPECSLRKILKHNKLNRIVL